MRIPPILLLAGMAGLFLILPAAMAAVPPDAAAAQVTVLQVTVDPEVFMEGETGTITVLVANTGNTSVPIRRATLYDNNFILQSQPYDVTMHLGPGTQMTYSFTVRNKAPVGIYYPVFSLDFRDAGSLRYPIRIQVENTPIGIAVVDKPDAFSIGRKDTVRFRISNPRDNAVNSVTITPAGTGFTPTPTEYFIGTLAADGATEVAFQLAPDRETGADFVVSYKNGVNPHSVNLSLPLPVGESKKMARPVTSNIVVEKSGGITRITGDVTNSGLETANAVTVTTGSPAIASDPYKVYAVGALKPDDFSSFEVTFRVENATSVPLVITYLDNDGNPTTWSTPVDIRAKPGGNGGQASGGPPLPVLLLLGVVVIGIAGVTLYIWRKR